MQIISGKYKHKRFVSPNDNQTHPMGNREKLALFNTLAGRVQGATVLDAFAGTGALGLEALSHGAKRAVFVEKSPKIAKTLMHNLQTVLGTDQPSLARLVVTEVAKFHPTERFDLIFADPPYDFYSEALISPLEGLLAPSGVLCLSLPRTAPEPVFDSLTPISVKTYAAAKIIIFQKK